MPTTPDQLSRRLEPGVLVTLYELDLTGKTSKLNGQPGHIHYFHDGIDPIGTELINFKGKQYGPFPIKADGFEWTTRGTLPRPKLSVSNIGSITSALLREFDDLVGAVVTIRRTFKIYLDGQPEGGAPYKEFTPLVFVVDRKSAETNTAVSFELATGMDAEGVLLPRRQILSTACPWTYRGVECGYGGTVIMNRLGRHFGVPITDGVVADRQKVFTDGTTNWNSPILTSATAKFVNDDAGKLLSGNGIPVDAANPNKIVTVNSLTSVTMNHNPYLAYPTGGATFTVEGRGRSQLTSNDTTFTSANLQQVVSSTRLPAGTKIVLIRSTHVVELSTKALTNGATTFYLGNLTGTGGGPIGPWNTNIEYALNEVVYQLTNGVRTYAVSKRGGNLNKSIYDENWWMVDTCLKKLQDCEIHFGAQAQLPYGGFPGASKLSGG